MSTSSGDALRLNSRLSLRSGIVWALGALLSAGIALFSYRYLLHVGIVPPQIAANRHVSPWLVIHVAGAATGLLLGPAQFLPGLRARHRRVHRWIGRTYAVSCIVGGVAGLVLALGATTGLISTAGFGLLAVLWMITTALAWRHALKRDFIEHRRWMIRSFALTLAAVTLRLYLPISMLLPFLSEEAYRAISFLCWVPNLIVAELYLARRS